MPELPNGVKPRKFIRRVSLSRAKQLRLYETKLKLAFFATHHHCFVCGMKLYPEEKVLHHWAKRRGKLLTWVPGFRLTDSGCHTVIHNDEAYARERGRLAPKECCDDFKRAQDYHRANFT